MSLNEWYKERCGTDLGASEGLHGSALASLLSQALVDGGYDYGEQRHLLLAAADHHHDLDFGNACLDRVDAIDAFLVRRAAMVDREVRERHSSVAKNKDWAMGATYADLRFSPARPVVEELLDGVDAMTRRVAEEGYVELHPDVLRDLRQGLGYYRPGEDTLRRRRTVRWLRGQNVLHCWVATMLGGRNPLIRVAEGAPGCWVTAANLFVDRQGKAFTYSRLEHGTLRNEEVSRWLRSIIPASTAAH